MDNDEKIFERLREDAHAGLDGSPGDPICFWALSEIKKLKLQVSDSEEMFAECGKLNREIFDLKDEVAELRKERRDVSMWSKFCSDSKKEIADLKAESESLKKLVSELKSQLEDYVNDTKMWEEKERIDLQAKNKQLREALEGFKLWYMTLGHMNPDSLEVLKSIIPKYIIDKIDSVIAKKALEANNEC